MSDRHKSTPLRFRPPAAERQWLADYQQRTGKPMNAILTEAVQRLREDVAAAAMDQAAAVVGRAGGKR